MVFMLDAYRYDSKRGNVVLKLNSKLAPVKVAVLPIVKNDSKVVKMSNEVFNTLKEEWNVVYDGSGSLGRRYSRQDEGGTPFCITIDNVSLKGKDVTIRNRDSTEQIRVKIKYLKRVVGGLLGGENFKKAGKLVSTRK
jgi:glycyl-tRNA synthetase